jgi:hypothetical protein
MGEVKARSWRKREYEFITSMLRLPKKGRMGEDGSKIMQLIYRWLWPMFIKYELTHTLEP